MKMVSKFLSAIVSLFSLGSIHAMDQHITESTFSVKEKESISNSPFPLLNIKQSGHSDGYTEKLVNGAKKQVFLGTNHYKAQMVVTNNGKKTLIDVSYSIADPNITGSKETPENPKSIVIGEYLVSGSKDFEERFIKDTSKKEIAQLKSIGLTKEAFTLILKQHAIEVYYI